MRPMDAIRTGEGDKGDHYLAGRGAVVDTPGRNIT